MIDEGTELAEKAAASSDERVVPAQREVSTPPRADCITAAGKAE
jgi:hypothetical protein